MADKKITMDDVLAVIHQVEINRLKYEKRREEFEKKSNKSREEFEKKSNKRREEFERKSEKRREESEKRRKEFEKKSEKRREESEKKRAEADREYEEERKEEAKEYKKRQELSDKQTQEIKNEMQELLRVYRKAGLIQGKSAEESVYRSVSKLMDKRGKDFSSVRRNVSVKKNGKRFAEYDIVAVNGIEVLPIEVKSRFTTDDVDRFVDIQLPKFRKAFPKYNDYKLLGGVGGLVMSESVEKYAQKKGLYVFVQNGENMALANSKNFVAKVFS